MKIVVRTVIACRMSRRLARNLLVELTNDPSRGDYSDSGTSAGSAMGPQLNRYLSRHSTKPSFTPGTIAIVGRRGHQLVGWTLLAPIDDDLSENGRAEINFYVNPQFRRRGIARQLLVHAVKYCRAHDITTLTGLPWNNGSSDFFVNSGFRLIFAHQTADAWGTGWNGRADLHVATWHGDDDVD